MSYSKKFKKKFLQLLETQGGNINATLNIPEVKARGLHRTTVYKWKDKEEWFREAIWEIKEGWIDNVESALLKNALEDSGTADRIFFLKTQAKHRGYIERSEIKDMTPPQKPDLSPLTDEELIEYDRILTKIQEGNAE